MGNHSNKWYKTGVVIEVCQYHQYVITVDRSGRITLRNRKFLQKFTPMHQLDGRRSILDDLKYLQTSDFTNQSSSTPTTLIDPPSSPPKVSTSPSSIYQYLPTTLPCSPGFLSVPPATSHIVASPPLISPSQAPIQRLHCSYPMLIRISSIQLTMFYPNQKISNFQ